MTMIQRDRAIVLGGSMAGLFAARVLSDHFNEVLILERDTLPSEAEIRNGTPQARHLHQLLASGQRVMERLFPELKDDLREVGAPEMEWGVDNIILLPEGRGAVMPSGIVTNTCSRATLEFLIRRRLLEHDNVKILEKHRIQGLIATDDNSRITGVQVKVGREQHEMFADFIVDATGRASKTPDYFEALGYEKPEQSYVNAHIGYSTAWFKKPDDLAEDFVMMASLSTGADVYPGGGNRSGIITKIEGDRWVAIIASNNKDYPPTDLPGFLEFTKTLHGLDIYEALRDAEPISPVYGSRTTYSIWQHYEKLDRRPENFIITGDAACGFNPIYGQGMSVAAMDAELLDDCLREWDEGDLTGFATHFQMKLADFLVAPWDMATTADKYEPTAVGDIEVAGRLKRMADVYFAWVLAAVAVDPVVNRAFLRVMNMLDKPETLGKPGILLRVLRHRFFGQKPPTQPAQSVPVTAAGD
ncbi:MAG: FAD-dependent oxidoreductase [Aggregatilineales bacterium]